MENTNKKRYRELYREGNVGVGIDIINICNAKCPICYYEYFEQSSFRKIMSLENVKKIIYQAKVNGFKELYLLGGEPTLFPKDQLIEIINYAKENIGSVLLVSNGLKFADEEFCKDIMETGASIVVQKHVMVNGKEDNSEIERKKKLENKRLGVEDGFEKNTKAFENIEKYFHPDKVSVQCSITKDLVEYGDIIDVFYYARKKGYEIIIECSKSNPKFLRGNGDDLSPEELTNLYKIFQEIDAKHFPDKKADSLTPNAYGFVCTMSRTSIHFLINGDAIPCVGQPYILGNIFSQDLKEILDNPVRNFFRFPEKQVSGYCKDCDKLELCTAGCRGEAFSSTGYSQGDYGCYKASVIQCPELERLKKIKGEGLKIKDIIPLSCEGCPLEDYDKCKLNPKIVSETIDLYLGKDSI